DLEAYQNGFATRAEDAGTLRKLVLFVKRHKAVSVLVSAMLLGAVLFTVRLAASEKVALANAERAAASAEEAKRNEQKAQESAQEAKTSAKKALESESLAVSNAKKAEESAAESRRSAAMAELTAAEGAEANGNVQQMRDSLSRVPSDLRSQTWEYLDRRLNSMDMVIKAPEDSPWVTMVPVPDQAGVFYTLQRDGSVRVLDLNTGSTDLLFKAGFTGGPSGLLLSGDGLRIAVAFNSFKVKIFSVWDGSVVSEFITAHQIAATSMVEGGNLKMRGCLNRDGSRLLSVAWSAGPGSIDSRFQLWDVDAKKVLWNSPRKERCVVEFTSDNRLMMLTDEGLSELDPNSGDALTRFSKITYPAYGPNSAATFATDARWDFLFTVGGDGILRKTMSKDGAVTLGMSARGSGLGEFQTFQYLPKSKRIITLVSTSLEGGQMQVWNDKGILGFSVPVLAGAAPKLGVHPASEDLCLMRRRDILVWRLGVHNSVSKETWHDQGNARFRASGFIYPGENRASFKRNGEALQLHIEENRKSIQNFHVHGADGGSDFSYSFSNLTPMICKNLKGDWFAVTSSWQRGVVFRFHATQAGVEAGAVIKVDSKRIPNSVDCPPPKNLCMSPDGQKLWIGNMVLGSEAESVPVEADRQGLGFKRVGGMLACWAGNQCVAEIAVLNSSEGDEGGDASGKTVLVLWDAATGKRLKTVEALSAVTLEGSPDGKWIAEGGSDKRIRFRDSRTLEVVREIRAHDAPVGDLK
ncbi:MAG: WD40 repeat domain-containing protein, partial [Chthoniobacteraceae bacterium]|nr:WD40 repeat domain-containing protein [Chthoniobacteraceae bacterium]